MSETFKELFENSKTLVDFEIGGFIMGSVMEVGESRVVIGVGLKSEGHVSLDEFKNSDGIVEVEKGDVVEVVLKQLDDGLGNTLISYSEAKGKRVWGELEGVMDKKVTAEYLVTGATKGGLIGNVKGVDAFLPGSLAEAHLVKDLGDMVGETIDVKVIKMDIGRGNIVVSRKAVVQETNVVQRKDLIEKLEVGAEVEGVVKNIANYGAFIDIGGIDGLLHITDISWKRIKHPSEELSIGSRISVKVLKFEKDSNRISLGLKQMSNSPWDGAADRLPVGKKITGKVLRVMDYGAFVEIEGGLEGLVHVSEMSWGNSNAVAAKEVSVGEAIDVVIMDINESKHRIALSIKQATDNPWVAFENSHNIGDEINVVVRASTDFGLFVGLPGGIEGLIHISDISNEKIDGGEILRLYSKGTEVRVSVLGINIKKNRISFGIKQVGANDESQLLNKYKEGGFSGGKVGDILKP